jgi:hypothetical protein
MTSLSPNLEKQVAQYGVALVLTCVAACCINSVALADADDPPILYSKSSELLRITGVSRVFRRKDTGETPVIQINSQNLRYSEGLRDPCNAIFM